MQKQWHLVNHIGCQIRPIRSSTWDCHYQKNKTIRLLSSAQNTTALINETVHCCTQCPLLYELKWLIYSRIYRKKAHWYHSAVLVQNSVSRPTVPHSIWSCNVVLFYVQRSVHRVIYGNTYPTKCNNMQFIYISKPICMFRVVSPPTIRSSYHCITVAGWEL